MNVGVLIWLGRRFKERLKTGDLFLVYMIFYGVGRFFLEFLRLDPSPVAGVDANQMLMAIIVVVSTASLLVRHRLFPTHTAPEKVVEEPEMKATITPLTEGPAVPQVEVEPGRSEEQTKSED